jgi:hypothetical protein
MSKPLPYQPFTGCSQSCVCNKSFILCDKSVKFARPFQAMERISKLLSTMLPAGNAELTMILATQFEEGVDTILAHWHAGYTCSANLSCACIHETHNCLQSCHYSQKRPYSWNHEYSRDCQSQALKDSRNNIEGIQHIIVKVTSLELGDIIKSTCQFVMKYVIKVHNCFVLHCNSNADNFVKCNPNLKFTNFKCTCEEVTIKEKVGRYHICKMN